LYVILVQVLSNLDSRRDESVNHSEMGTLLWNRKNIRPHRSPQYFLDDLKIFDASNNHNNLLHNLMMIGGRITY
jgi:hypothetical protein